MIKLNSVKFECYSPNFTGMPKEAPSRYIGNANDAIKQWEVMKHPQYSEIIQEEEVATDRDIARAKQIREKNYSFLDRLYRDSDKEKFVEHFRTVTGFPVLKESTQKILDEYNRVLSLSSSKMDYARPYDQQGDSHSNILMAGYDEFCSVGQNTAIPGSDVDKAYAIVAGPRRWAMSEKEFSDRIKGHIWNNIDNRIMSVNHSAAFPNIMTLEELKDTVSRADKYAGNFVDTDNMNYFRYQRLENDNMVSGARFNIWLSQRIPTKKEKSEMKNLAYVVEAMRDGKKIEIYPYYYNEDIYNLMSNSLFCHCSNIIQSKPMQDKYDYSTENILKPKLVARQEVENEFDSWSVKEQYDLVKDIIRSMSGDSKNPDFKDLFASKTDLHRLLLNDILRGKVECAIEHSTYGGERITLFFNDPETMEKYATLNVYKTSY